MKIDRSAFLIMTGAIAASAACVIQTGPQPTTGTPSSTTAAAPTTAPAPTPTAATPTSGGPVRVGTPSLFNGFTHNNTGITPPPPPPPGQNPPPASCLDEGPVSSTPACQGACAGRCSTFGQALEPKVAAAAVACLNTAGNCSDATATQCGQQALAQACPSTDSGAQQACAQAAAASGCQTTQQQCIAQVSGFSQAGVSALGSCITEGGSLCASNTLAACVQKVLLTAPSAEGGGCATTPPPASSNTPSPPTPVNQATIHHH